MPKRKKRISKIVYYLVILIAALFFIYKIIGLIVHSKKEVVVPNIINKSVIDALDMVSKLGLGLKKVGEVYNPNFPQGTVVAQQPSAGMTVRVGRFVNVVLSLGGEKVFVPNIIGEDRRKAEIVLREYSLFVGTVTERYSLKYPKNKVVQQIPQAGEIVEKNSYINFVVSLGVPPEDKNIIIIPDFINKNINEVYLWAQKYGIEVQVIQKVVPDAVEGTVIEQNPPPDEIVDISTILKVTVAQTTTGTYQPQYNFEYEIPFIGNTSKKVKIVQISDEGEYVLYDKATMSGQKIQLYVPTRKNSRIRIFLDGVLIDEK